MKTSNKQLNNNVKETIVADLIGTLAQVDHPKEMSCFLQNFLSDNELLGLAKRLAIIKALQNKQSYEEIQKKYLVSSATVSSLAECKLNNL